MYHNRKSHRTINRLVIVTYMHARTRARTHVCVCVEEEVEREGGREHFIQELWTRDAIREKIPRLLFNRRNQNVNVFLNFKYDIFGSFFLIS